MDPFEEASFDIDRDAYNAFVQEAQAEAISFGMEHRVRSEHLEGGRIDGHFEVYWNRWQELGCEINAMTPDCRRAIFPERKELIFAQAAAALQ